MPDHIHGIIIINYSRDYLVVAKHASPLPDKGLEISKHNVQSEAWDTSNLPTEVYSIKSGSLSAIIQSFKSASSRLIHSILNIKDPIWQRSFYDHIIRNESELSKIYDYIVNNPFYWPGDPDL